MREGELSVREQLEQRVGELRAEQQKGQQVLAELEAKQAELRQTLLRISGGSSSLRFATSGQIWFCRDSARRSSSCWKSSPRPPL